jgi:hypothetical protein
MFILVGSPLPSKHYKSQYLLTILQTTISDLVQISPEDFSKFSAVAIEDNINEKYANKVHDLPFFYLHRHSIKLEVNFID